MFWRMDKMEWKSPVRPAAEPSLAKPDRTEPNRTEPTQASSLLTNVTS
jgi:hypothetical protein